MRRDLVERRGWISEKDYKDGLALSQLAPGPLAAQLAIYIGFVHFGILGATAAGLAFVLPSFLMVVALGWAYVRYGGLPWMQAVFYGVGACVIGIIALSAYRLTRRSVGSGRLLLAIWLVAAVVTVITESEEVLLFLAAGVLAWLVKTPEVLRSRPRSRIAPGPSGHEPRRPRRGSPREDARVLRLRGNVRLRQRSRHRAVPLRRSGQGLRLAHRTAISRCGRGGAHHARSCGHHHRIHRVPRGRIVRSHRGRDGDLPPRAIC